MDQTATRPVAVHAQEGAQHGRAAPAGAREPEDIPGRLSVPCVHQCDMIWTWMQKAPWKLSIHGLQ